MIGKEGNEMKRIIYPNDTGIAVMIPSPEWQGTIQELAIKDVLNGTPFLIIDTSFIPDRSQRNLWQADFTNPDGYGGQV